jgi:hypothetical protein
MGDFVSIAAIVLLGPWVLVWRASSRRKREQADAYSNLIFASR